jgi:hypothetical protein
MVGFIGGKRVAPALLPLAEERGRDHSAATD